VCLQRGGGGAGQKNPGELSAKTFRRKLLARGSKGREEKTVQWGQRVL